MKYLLPALLLSLLVSSAGAAEKPVRAHAIGIGSGAVVGAFAGGPLGAFVGAAIGAHYADRVGVSGQLPGVEADLRSTQAALGESETRVAKLNRSLFETRGELQLLGEEMSELLLQRAVFEGLQMEVLYPTGTAELGSDAAARVARLAGLLAQIPEMTVRLDGYADPRGDESYNADLSRARAEAVRDALVANGTDPRRISVYAHGETAVTSDNGDLDKYALERRVRIRLDASNGTGRVAQQD